MSLEQRHRRRYALHVLIAAVCPLATAASVRAQASVQVTGRLLSVNGHTDVPRGLFGLHADSKLSAERARDWGVDSFRQIHFGPGSGSIAWGKDGRLREPFKSMPVVIDCQGDRYCPALCLTRPDYKEFFQRIGREYAEKCKRVGWKGIAEFWNEPYLNWAERSRKNYNPKYYDESKAVEDGPVTIKGWDKPLKYLRWRRLWAKDQSDSKGKINYLVPVPKGAKAGDTFEHELKLYFMPKGKRKYTVVEKWDVYDPTAVSYWSARQNYDFYMWMFLPWAKAIKQANPQITVIGGWDFHINSSNWKAWEMLYKPMIDESIRFLDGVTEHHYGSDTRMTAATYEVVVGYAMAEHGKWLHCYNTETAGCVDPAVPGNRHGNATPYGAYNYGLRDIVELIYRSPDKAVSRAAHGSLAPGWGGGGDEFRFKLLKDFRGKLVHCASDDLDVWPIACVSGGELIVVLFNDHREERAVSLSLAAPAGTTLGKGSRHWVVPTIAKGPLEFRQAEIAAAGASLKQDIRLPQRTGVKLAFPLTGTVRKEPQLLRRQFFAKGVLNNVVPRKSVGLAVAVDAELLSRAESAQVKLVLEGVGDGEATMRVNGTAVKLPDHDWLTEVPIDRKLLRASNTLTFETSGNGYQVDVASIVLDAPAK